MAPKRRRKPRKPSVKKNRSRPTTTIAGTNEYEIARIHREEDAERARQRGWVSRDVSVGGGSAEKVWSYPNTFASLKLEPHQAEAYNRFSSAYDKANSTDVKAAGLEPGVDGGRADFHARHLMRNEAQKQIDKVREALGPRKWDIFLAFYHGMSTRRAHELKGPEHRTVAAFARSLLDDLSEFYTGSRNMDRLWKAAQDYNREIEQKIEWMRGAERQADMASISASGISVTESKRRAKLRAERY